MAATSEQQDAVSVVWDVELEGQFHEAVVIRWYSANWENCKKVWEACKAGCREKAKTFGEKAGEVSEAVWEKANACWIGVKGIVFDDDSISTQDWDVGLAQTMMVVDFTGVAGLGALKIQDTGYEIELPLTPLIIGFGLAFTAACFTMLLEEKYPRDGKVIGKLGLVATATTFFAMVIGLLM